MLSYLLLFDGLQEKFTFFVVSQLIYKCYFSFVANLISVLSLECVSCVGSNLISYFDAFFKVFSRFTVGFRRFIGSYVFLSGPSQINQCRSAPVADWLNAALQSRRYSDSSHTPELVKFRFCSDRHKQAPPKVEFTPQSGHYMKSNGQNN